MSNSHIIDGNNEQNE